MEFPPIGILGWSDESSGLQTNSCTTFEAFQNPFGLPLPGTKISGNRSKAIYSCVSPLRVSSSGPRREASQVGDGQGRSGHRGIYSGFGAGSELAPGGAPTVAGGAVDGGVADMAWRLVGFPPNKQKRLPLRAAVFIQELAVRFHQQYINYGI